MTEARKLIDIVKSHKDRLRDYLDTFASITQDRDGYISVWDTKDVRLGSDGDWHAVDGDSYLHEITFFKEEETASDYHTCMILPDDLEETAAVSGPRKLIDILKDNLGKFSKINKGFVCITQDTDGYVSVWDTDEVYMDAGGDWEESNKDKSLYYEHEHVWLEEVACDVRTCKVIPSDFDEDLQLDEEYKFVYTGNSLTIYKDGEPFTLDRECPTFAEAVGLILVGDVKGAWGAANVKQALERLSEGSIVVEDGVVTCNGFPINNGMSDRLLQMMEDGAEGVETFARFFSSLMEVQDARVIEELYAFLKHSDIKLNDDGSFEGYKAVQSDFTDKHTGTLSNAPGEVVTMPRSMVDSDANRTCSTGLHVGSHEYASSFGSRSSDKIVLVKVWPQDVVSVPNDYNGQKLRACKYEVLKEVGRINKQTHW